MSGLCLALLRRPELFVGTLTEKLMTYGLGRGVEPYDAPAVRAIVRHARSKTIDSRRSFSASWERSISDEGVAMMVTKNALPRRTFLRGVGTALALPLLDAMVPAFRPGADHSDERAAARLRLHPDGHERRGVDAGDRGTHHRAVAVAASLTPLLDHITVVTNLELRNAYTTGNHASSNCAFLSCSRAKRTEGSDYELGTTVDQIAARAIGRDTQIPSLEIGTDLIAQVGNCDNGYACAYQNNLSWSSRRRRCRPRPIRA